VFSSVHLTVRYKGGHATWGKKVPRMDEWPEAKDEAERYDEASSKAWSSVTTGTSFLFVRTCLQSDQGGDQGNTTFDMLIQQQLFAVFLHLLQQSGYKMGLKCGISVCCSN